MNLAITLVVSANLIERKRSGLLRSIQIMKGAKMFSKPLFSVLAGGTEHARRRLYECLNPMCFYCETLLKTDEVVWKEVWDSDFEDLVMRPRCPSCSEAMAFWDYDTEAEMLRDEKEVSDGKKTENEKQSPE